MALAPCDLARRVGELLIVFLHDLAPHLVHADFAVTFHPVIFVWCPIEKVPLVPTSLKGLGFRTLIKVDIEVNEFTASQSSRNFIAATYVTLTGQSLASALQPLLSRAEAELDSQA